MGRKIIAELTGVVKNGRVEIPWKVAKELLDSKSLHNLQFVVKYKGTRSESSKILRVQDAETIKIELEIDPKETASLDDKYTLFSTDETQTYCKTLIVKDDKIDGDSILTLEYDMVKKDLNYSLKVDLGAESTPYFLFKSVPYSDLIK